MNKMPLEQPPDTQTTPPQSEPLGVTEPSAASAATTATTTTSVFPLRFYRLVMGLVRRLYDWVLHWAETPYGALALFIIAFAESSFFPIPPDVLLIALAISKPKRAFYFATICTAGSVLGGMFGYLIGWGLWSSLDGLFIPHVFSQASFDMVANLYQDNAFVAILTAAFTPIPYKVFTITAGVTKISFLTLILASLLGRTGRFFAVSTLIFVFGKPVKRFIDKYFDLVTIAFMILLIGGFVLIKYLA